MISPPPIKLANVQALRGLAALAVMALHLTGTQVEGGIRADQGLAAYGWAGVDLFFILSGFIMVWVTRDVPTGAGTAGRFMLARVARIYPLWWVCVLIIAALYMVIHGVPAPLALVPREDAWAHLLKSLVLIPGDQAPLVMVGWSLIHEMYFYLVFAAVLGLGLRRRLPAVLIAWAGLTAVGLWAGIDRAGWNGADVVVSDYTFHFIAGAAVGLLLTRDAPQRFGMVSLGVGVALLVGLLVTGQVSTDARLLTLTLPFCLVVYGAVAVEPSGRPVAGRVLTWLGDISYSLYLTHWMVLLAWQIVEPIYPGGFAHGLVAGWPAPVLLVVDTVILTVGCLVTAHIFHVAVERPALRIARERLPSYRQPAPLAPAPA